MSTFTILIGAIAWDEVRASSRAQALVFATARYPQRSADIWVREA